MGNTSCTSIEANYLQNDIVVDQGNGNTIFQTQYKTEIRQNEKNAKNETFLQIHSLDKVRGSKELKFGFGKPESKSQPKSSNGKDVIKVNAPQESTAQTRLEPIVFSIIDFQVFTDEQKDQASTTRELSSQRMAKLLSSTKDEQEQDIKINQTAIDYILSYIDVVPRIDVNKEQFIRIKKQNIQNDYKLEEKLGEGTFGQVYRCTHKKTNEVRAAKILKKNIFINPKLKQQFLQQFQILKKMDHPNILKIFQIYQKNKSLCIVSQFCKGNSLASYLKRKIQFTTETKKEILHQIFLGVNYLHQKKVLHRDLKPDNIVFINPLDQASTPQDVDLRIIDFGLAIEIDEATFKDWANIGTYNFMAPQAFQGIYSNKCDSWACGVIMYMLLLGFNPFKGFNLDEVRENIRNYFPIESNFKDIQLSAIDLLMHLTKINYIIRWDLKEALISDYFAKEEQQMSKSCILARLASYNQPNGFISAIQSYLVFNRVSQTQQGTIKKYFNALNLNKNGSISIEQLKKMFHESERDQITSYFKKIDKDHSGTIDFSQFLAMMVGRRQLFTLQNLQDVYDFIDINKNGKITNEQMKYFLRVVDKSTINSLIEEISGKGRNYVTFDEFSSYLLKEKWL